MNESTSPEAVGKSGSTNRACENCSRAKAKCTPQVDGSDGRCSRCFRLKKDCTTAPRRARKRRSPNHTTNVAQLEEKIESLVSLLGAHTNVLKPDLLQPLTRETSSQSERTPQDHTLDSQYDQSPVILGARQLYRGNDAWLSQSMPNRNLYPASATSDLSGPSSLAQSHPLQIVPALAQQVQQSILPGPEADDILDTFREQFAPQFPFIIVPNNVNSENLHRQRPWVYRAVTLIGNETDRTAQLEASKRISLDVMEALTVRGEKNLDMLQGLLLHNAWIYYYSPVTPQFQSTAIFQIAQALVFDLGLNKPVRETEMTELLPEAYKHRPDTNPRESKRTVDERRTYLTCYFSTSVFSLHIRKSELMHHTPYLDYCCKVLQENPEYPSDAVLSALVRLQCITESFQRNLVQTYEGPMDENRAPAWMYVEGMRSELRQFWASLDPDLRSNNMLLMTFHSAEAFLSEPSAQIGLIPSRVGGGNAQRLDMLYSCLMASQALLNHILTQPLSSFRYFSVIQLAFTGVGLSTLFKLSMAEEPGWDLADVRKTVNVTDFFHRLIEKFEQAGMIIDSSQVTPSSRHSFPSGCAKAMRRVLAVYETRLAAVPGTQISLEPQLTTGMEGIMSGDQFDWIDDAYWQELLGDINFLPQSGGMS